MNFSKDGLSLTAMVHALDIFLDELSLKEILDTPLNGIKSVKTQQPSLEFIQSTSKVGANSKAGVKKKFI